MRVSRTLLAQGATPWNPRWLKAPLLRHAALAPLAQGATPWNPRWLKAPLLRHAALALLAQGAFAVQRCAGWWCSYVM